jgi:hypothetical protein
VLRVYKGSRPRALGPLVLSKTPVLLRTLRSDPQKGLGPWDPAVISVSSPSGLDVDPCGPCQGPSVGCHVGSRGPGPQGVPFGPVGPFTGLV